MSVVPDPKRDESRREHALTGHLNRLSHSRNSNDVAEASPAGHGLERQEATFFHKSSVVFRN